MFMIPQRESLKSIRGDMIEMARSKTKDSVAEPEAEECSLKRRKERRVNEENWKNKLIPGKEQLQKHVRSAWQCLRTSENKEKKSDEVKVKDVAEIVLESL